MVRTPGPQAAAAPARRRAAAALAARAEAGRGASVAPQLRFLWGRITPGGARASSSTTTIAIASVGGFVFGAYADELATTPRLTPADKEIDDLTIDLENDTLVEIAKVVTDLGSLAVIAAAAC